MCNGLISLIVICQLGSQREYVSLIFGCMDRSTHTENLDLYNIAQKCIKIIIGACIKFKLVVVNFTISNIIIHV